MKGIFIKKASIIAEDERRKIISVLNGELNIRDIHILHMKEGGKILGNHYHWYPEVMFIMKGGGTWYLKNRTHDSNEENGSNEMEIKLEEGDIMIKAPFITHTAIVDADSIILDGSAESWVGEDFNHYKEVLK